MMRLFKKIPYLNLAANVFIIIAVIIGFALIIEHSTHHLDDHGRCEICIFVNALIAVALFLMIIRFAQIDSIHIFLINQLSKPLYSSNISRAPPAV